MRKGEFFSQGLMSFPYMNTNLTKRLVFNKQERRKIFTRSYVLSLYEHKSHKETCFQQASRPEKTFTGSYVLSLYEYKSHKETCFVRFVFNKQADKRKKRQTESEKGEFFHSVLCAFLV